MSRKIKILRPKRKIMPSEGPFSVFVYGDMTSEGPNRLDLEDLIGEDSVAGYRVTKTNDGRDTLVTSVDKDVVRGEVYKLKYFQILNLDSIMPKDFVRRLIDLESGDKTYTYVYEPKRIILDKKSRFYKLYSFLKISSSGLKKKAEGQMESFEIESEKDLIEAINKDSHYIYLDNPVDSYKRFGDKKIKLPFDYGEFSELINPADNMGWDIIIVPSDSGSYKREISPNSHSLVPVGVVVVNPSKAIWKEKTSGRKSPPIGNDKIILAPDGFYTEQDVETLEKFFEKLWQFKNINWY